MVETKTPFDEKEMDYQEATAVDAPIVEGDVVVAAVKESSAEEDTPTSTTPSSSDSKDKMIASGVTGAVLGFLFGGPIGSALFGFTAAYVAQKSGAPGDAARALGDVGLHVRAKALEVDEKHKIVDTTSKTATEIWETAKKLDGETQVLEKSRGFVVDSWMSFVKFVKDRQLLEKGVDTAGKGYEFVADKVSRTK